MNLFNSNHLFRRKRSAFEIQDLPGLWRVHYQIGRLTILSTFYTRHDQACLLWGGICALIFVMAQFCSMSWTLQAIISSMVSLIGIIGMIALTRYFTIHERLNDVLFAWAGVVLLGLMLTNVGVFLRSGMILARICPIWLGLSAIGYGYTGVRMRSRTFLVASVIHLLTIAALPYVGVWQPLSTGIVISLTVLLIAELQWDAQGVCGHHTLPSPTSLATMQTH